ncbi:MAG: hypothetical protein GY727_07300 [Gammaproteobacteria bacterium]|nr:hypothetical protein [Gammaproteobacteria bacterium]MCP4091678.1 hypothetical protein [Gammaproteobacteria bacterium]MCP4276174.1 hypothetical protein [Gammaproteobacteria bacterium]MCP4831808.1 hypothetical protein [Gammaproteobacteria bacterium]MCP4929744.1 hypothetical protein [Gammaproteobacteria bacterium]
MTKHGALNLLGMFLLPVAAVIAGAIGTVNGVWNAYTDTYIFIFALNSAITVPAAFFSWLFLRRSIGNGPRWFAILPLMAPATYGTVWYLWRSVVPDEIAPGAEFLAAPQYLLIGMIITTFIVLLMRITGLAPRGS